MRVIITPLIFLFSVKVSFCQSNPADTGEIRALISRYAESINNGDSSLGSALFSHSPEVSFIHPKGHQHGWNEISTQIYDFFAKTFSSRKLSIIEEHVNVYEDVAWAEFYWVFDAVFRQGGMKLQTKGRETQIWKRTNNEWRLVHVHYSALPAAGS